ncbi:integral membrane protein [Aspergillus pseudodeflectus]|uniref:Integral membrane protein n=1 Tax=Aspergillus pseudodeflectus TaxID=176178 RepID=A0ABR4KEP8_9EURO
MPAGDDDRSVEVTAVAAVFMSVATVAVLLRCYVRGFLIKAFGWDDAVMVLAMAFYLMFSGCMIGGAIYGTGRKFAVLTAHERVTAMKYWWLCEIAYCFASIGCKVSVCIFLMRITVKRLHIWLLCAVMAFTVLTGLLFMFIMLLQCKPLEYFWTRTALDPTIEGHCISIEIVITMTYVYSAFAALCDFTVGILPIFIVRKLHMRRKTKMAVVGILGMACIASSAVIVRFPYVKTFRDPDFLYATVEIAIWSNIEAGLGITAGSLATLRPLLRHWLGSTTSDGDYNNASPFPGRSGSKRLASGTRDRDRNRAFPLGSLDNSSLQGRLRPDKAVTVTTVHTRHDHDEGSGEGWRGGSVSSSEERLTLERERHGGRGVDASSNSGMGMGLGIHQMIEVTQTSSDVQSTSVKEHV